jgi:hypothetical protein
VTDEWLAEQVMERRTEILAHDWSRSDVGEDRLEWVRPRDGVVCFPRMRVEPPGGTRAFYRRLREGRGAYVRPGHWFEMPDTCFRVG